MALEKPRVSRSNGTAPQSGYTYFVRYSSARNGLRGSKRHRAGENEGGRERWLDTQEWSERASERANEREREREGDRETPGTTGERERRICLNISVLQRLAIDMI